MNSDNTKIKLRFSNLGSIKDAELRLNNLTIIAGPNNSGKTYITYSIYGLFKTWKDNLSFPAIDKYVDQLLQDGTVSFSKSLIEDLKRNIASNISKQYSAQIGTVFNDKEDLLKKSAIEISNLNLHIDVNFSRRVQVGKGISFECNYSEDLLVITYLNKNEDPNPPKVIVRDIIYGFLGELIMVKSFPYPFILTSERLGIALFYKELDATKNVLVGELQRLGHDNRGFNPLSFFEKLSAYYASPIKDEIQFTRAIEKIQKRPRNDDFKEIIDRVKRMMGGYYKHVGNELRFISTSRKDKFDLPLFMASSSARGLMEMYFFLRYIAEDGMILLIDEPESHLNPSNQIEFARIIALCVNSGIKVFITTHSDYILKELNNLIMLSNEFDGKVDFMRRYKKYYNERMFLSPEKIDAYISKDGSLESCLVDNKGMEISSFDDTIIEINTIADELDFNI